MAMRDNALVSGQRLDYRLRRIRGDDPAECEACYREQSTELRLSTLHAAVGLGKDDQVQEITVGIWYIFFVGQNNIDHQKSSTLFTGMDPGRNFNPGKIV